MKITKPIIAAVMTATLAFGMNTAAYAEHYKADLTVTGNELAGKEVTYVSIFTDDSDRSDDNPNYSLREVWKPFFKQELGFEVHTHPDISTEAYRYVVAMGDDSEELTRLAERAQKYYLDNVGDPDIFVRATGKAVAGNDGVVTFSDLDAGMYLVFPEAGSTSAARGTDAMLITLRNNPLEVINIKSEYPTVDKKVGAADADDAADYTDNTSAKVGDFVKFQLTSKVPEMSDYSTYVFNMCDELSTGLTLVKDNTHPMVLEIGGETLIEGTDYTYTPGNNSFDVKITDLKGLVANDRVAVDEEIILTYFAEVNENAVVDGDGNVNRAYIEYSNKSKLTGTGQSAPDTAIVYTYDIELFKYSLERTDEVALEGAKFSLYGDPKTTPISLVAVNGGYRIATPEEIADFSVTKITEITTPESGRIVIKGLSLDTTYYVSEVAAPTGYSKIENDITVIIKTDDVNTTDVTEADYGRVYYTINGTQNPNANDNDVKILNRPSSVLPSTGGMGTIGLTIAGAGIVVAGIIFATRKKKSKKA